MKVKAIGKGSITKKLFIITTLVFAIFLIGTLTIQSLFFEKFYLNKKQNEIKSLITQFHFDYSKARTDDKRVSILEEYEENDNVNIIVMGSGGRLNFIPRITKSKLEPIKSRDLTNFVGIWASKASNQRLLLNSNNRPITVTIRRKEDDIGELISILYDKRTKETIFMLSSLQPVDEAVSVIKSLYFYFSAGALLLIIILALFYSNMIAKPLLKISKVATKVAGLDFSEKCTVTSNDEIGVVASSLNFLSENLDNALNSLKEANAKLEQDIEKERKLEKMRKEFVAAVSHELKTPISLIDGYAVGLKDEIFEDEDDEYYLDIIIDETRKMNSLVSEMLDLSYLESGIFKLVREEFNLIDLLKLTIKKYETVITQKNVSIEMNLIENLIVYADYNRIEQVMTNFITNAFRHVNEKGIISISTVDAENSVSVEVENTGEHISEDEIDKVWDQFYKVDKSRNRKLGGTGIGLSIVKNILMMHSYTFGVKNTDRGVKFYFNVPKH